MSRFTVTCNFCKAKWVEDADRYDETGSRHHCEKLTVYIDRHMGKPWFGAGVRPAWRLWDAHGYGLFSTKLHKWRARPDGSTSKCDARCEGAKGFSCDCQCRGKNHGAKHAG